jgi:hypothetical protein
MSLSSRFNHDLCNALADELPGYKWKPEFSFSPASRERVDVGGEPVSGKQGPVVLVEAELRREDPASNILKVWTYLLDDQSKRRFPQGVLLIQGFSRVYRSKKHHNKGLKYKAAKILGALIQKNSNQRLKYTPVKIDYSSRAGSNEGNGARRNAAKRFGRQVAAIFRRKVTVNPLASPQCVPLARCAQLC